jgi:hypothetical protein
MSVGALISEPVRVFRRDVLSAIFEETGKMVPTVSLARRAGDPIDPLSRWRHE